MNANTSVKKKSRIAKSKLTAVLAPSLCACALLLCIVAANPSSNMGWSDDWSYIWSARVLSDTGRIVYNGYTQPMLGWQLYLGALFIKLLGFSFITLHVAMLPVAVAAVVLTHRILIRFGISMWNATLATLAIALSPLFLTLSFSFMTDIPGYFGLVLCLYACLRAVGAKTDRATVAWLLFASFTNLAAGTARQIAWLGTLILVPSTVWLLRRRRGVVPAGVSLWALSIVVIFLCVRWFEHQPFSVPEPLLQRPLQMAAMSELASTVMRAVLYIGLFLSPVFVGFLVRYPWYNPKLRQRAIIAATFFAAAILLLVLRHGPIYWLAPFEFSSGFDDTVVGLLGTPPQSYLLPICIALTILTFAALSASVLSLWGAPRRKEPKPLEESELSWRATASILGPYTAVYALLFVTRDPLFERYLLPLFLIVSIVILRLYQQKIADSLPAAFSVPLLLFLAIYFGLMKMHDSYAFQRARAAAAEEITASGVPRTQIRAGFEYDGWTQLEAAGYLNNENMRNPPGAYRPWVPPNVPAECQLAFSNHLTAIDPRYELSISPTPCGIPSQFAPVSYETWMPPRNRTIYIQKVR